MLTVLPRLAYAAGALAVTGGLAIAISTSALARDHYAAIAYSMTTHTAAASLSDWKTRQEADDEAISRCDNAGGSGDCQEVVYTSHSHHCLALVTTATDYSSASDKTKDGATRKAFEHTATKSSDPAKLKLGWCNLH